MAQLQSTSITGSLIVTGGITGSFSGSIASPGSNTQVLYNNSGVISADSGFVYSSGNVGIGTSSPTAKLDINGNTYIAGTITLPQNPVGTTYGNGVSAAPPYGIYQLAGDNDAIRLYAESAASNQVSMVFEVNDDIETAGNEWIWRNKKTYGDYLATTPMRLSGTGDVTFLGTGRFGAHAYIGTGIDQGYYQDSSNGAYRALSGATNPGYFFQSYNGATTTMFVGLDGTYAGKVGIGTSSPSLESGGAGLDILNASYTQLRVRSSTSSAGIEFKPSSGEIWEIQANNSNQWFVYNRSDDAYRLLIDGSGNVGIGTSTPSGQLSGTKGLSIVDATNAALGLSNGTNHWLNYLSSTTYRIWNNTSNEVMTILLNGNIGIGTTSPAQKLHVIGNTAVTGITSTGDRKLSLGILDINSGGTPNQIRINTTIPFNSPSADFTVNIKGFRYGAPQMVSLSIGWHYYLGSFFNETAISNGAWKPTISLAQDANGFVVIHLSSPAYWPKLYVESVYSSAYGDTYSSGWTWTDADLSNCTNVEVVPYQPLATDISGNAGSTSAVSGTTNYIPKFTSSTAIGNSIMYDASGDILIGTTTSIWANSGRGLIQINGTSQALLGLSINGTSAGYLYHNGTDLYNWNASNGAMMFGTNNTEKMRITAGGSLLIGGTVTPSEGPWKGTAVLGINGYDKVITGTLISTYTGATIGGHNSSLSGWSDLNIVGGNIIFRHNETESVRINTSGNVGIGTTSIGTDFKLAINGGDGSTTGPLMVFQNSGTGTGNGNGFIVGNYPLDAYLWNYEAASIIFGTSNAERIRITSAGNVGIGTTAPQKPLEVISNVNDFVSVGVAPLSVGQWTGIHFGYREANNLYRKSAIVFERTDLTANDAQGKIHILNGPQGSGGSATLSDAKLTIAENGNVGIGTTSPGTRLQVNSTANFGSVNDQLTLNGNVSGGSVSNPGYYGGLTFTGNGYEWGAIRTIQNNPGVSWYNRLAFFTMNGAAGQPAIERMSIDNSGLVGIGTTSPSQLLEVNGRALVNQFQYTKAIDYSSGDLNSLVTAGFYNGQGMSNAPGGNAGWFYVTVETYSGDNNWVHQTATTFGAGGNTANEVYTRTRAGGTWGSWKQLGDAASISGTTNYIPKFTSSTAIGNSVIYESSSNIGISTTDPRYQLDLAKVNDASQVDYIALGVNNGPGGGGGSSLGSGIIWKANYTGYTKRSAGIVQIAESNYFQSGLAFYTNGTADETTDWSERMRITKDGNVGIGTSSPAQKLDVSNGGIGFSGTGLNATDKKLYSPTDGDLEWMTNNAAVAHGFAVSNQGTKVVYLNTVGNSYLNGGNVGIGTNSPSQLLEVNGRALVNQFQYTKAINVGGSDLNSLVTAGFYDGSAMTNAPNSGWFYVTVETHVGGTDWVHQTATSFGSNNTPNEVYTRVRVGGTWGAWLQVVTANGGSWNINAATATNLSTNRTNWNTNGTISAVVGQLAWKNYGNNHTIFDASNSTTPGGGATSNTNPDVAWSSTYPTLMGWNGSSTYGVRVDSARTADSTSAVSGTTNYIAKFTSGTAIGNSQIFDNGTNVGIGTTSPLYKTVIQTSDNTVGLVVTTNANDTGTGLYITPDHTNGIVKLLASGGTSKAFGFFTGNDERMRITSAGNVGIGTTTPGAKLEVVGSFRATTKSFIIDHPTKENKKLQYGVLEGPEHSVYVRGKLTNTNVIQLPDYWHALVHENSITVNLTAIGKKQDLWVEEITDTHITVASETGEINCFYAVFAERKDVEKLVTEFDKE
jgi:hypothetical protein